MDIDIPPKGGAKMVETRKHYQAIRAHGFLLFQGQVPRGAKNRRPQQAKLELKTDQASGAGQRLARRGNTKDGLSQNAWQGRIAPPLAGGGQGEGFDGLKLALNFKGRVRLKFYGLRGPNRVYSTGH